MGAGLGPQGVWKLKITSLGKVALVASLALSSLVPTAAPALKATQNTPDDTVLAVTANLNEAWDHGDTLNHGDMDRFVARVLDEYRYKPDVLGLQEVRKSSAVYVAKKLSARSGQRYEVVVMPPKHPYFPYGGGRAGAKETTIVINTKTMKVLNGGGYFATVAKREHETEPNDPVFHQAFALLKKRGTNKKFATMSVHLLPRGYLASLDLDTYYRNKWAKQMHNKLRRSYGGRTGLRYLMLGDFNQWRCLRGNWSGCYQRSPFWKTLKGFGYQDTSKKQGPVDFIFSKGMPGAMHDMDSGYKALPPKKRYSDHAFRWAVLGPDRYPPTAPKPLKADLREKPGGNPIVWTGWGKSDDRAGSGVVGIEYWKKLNTDKWARVKPSKERAHYDEQLDWSDTVRYRVRAVDKAGNKSAYLYRTVEVRQGNVDKV